MDNTEKAGRISENLVPVIMIDDNGKVVYANSRISDVFIYDQLEGADFFSITAVPNQEVVPADGFLDTELKRNGKVFRLYVYKDEYKGQDVRAVLFFDVTPYSLLKEKYDNEKPCCMKIEVDNYNDLIYPSGESPRLELSSAIDKAVASWLEKYDASITRTMNGKYLVWFERRFLKEMTEKNFPVLDEVRDIDTGEDFPASLSIGVGVGGKTLSEGEDYAEMALELALGRGGDQAVVKNEQKMQYYGGTIQTAENHSKGKSKMIGHALKQLTADAKNVIIMGHRYADMDSFGAAMGIYRLVREWEKEPYIVLDEVTETLESIYNQAKYVDEYNIISSDRAIELAESNSLLVVVDTHRKSLVQCPAILDVCDKIAIIDHHRRVEDMIDNPTVAYMETYASSASEMVTEILQFMTEKKKVNKLEAEALLSGIIVDTDAFAMKTGVRTFETAAWLRRQGADPTEVKRYFQEDFENVKIKSLALLKAQIYEGGIAITTLDFVNPEAQIMCAQIADELLTLKGVKASFTVGNNCEKTVISARSLGSMNVQTVMEKFGGGGHLTVAAAQVDTSIDDTVCKIMEILKINGGETNEGNIA
ncbi:MAG: DHH family phosphoesterase [Clostridia bacterium]|nr:DHH family phosphoesterase [Clostridia bacterium]